MLKKVTILFLLEKYLRARKVPIGIEKSTGVNIIIPEKPSFFLILTIILFRLENVFIFPFNPLLFHMFVPVICSTALSSNGNSFEKT